MVQFKYAHVDKYTLYTSACTDHVLEAVKNVQLGTNHVNTPTHFVVVFLACILCLQISLKH